MITYQLDYVVEEILKSQPNREQIFLKKYIGKDFPKKEANYLWERILDHKWYVSERLGRDIGFRVAAIDYVENIYEPETIFGNKTNRSNGLRKFLKPLSSGLSSYFIAKSKLLS